jgi:outer membrane protein assembly factor BamB
MTRAGRFSLFAVAVALAGSTLAAAAPPARDQWLQFRLNEHNNVVLPGTLHASWKFETGGPISASPAVSGDVVYVGNNKGHFVALDAKTGKLLWDHTVKSPLMAQPLLVGKAVVVGEGDENSDVRRGVVHVGLGENALLAYDRTNGRGLWTVPLPGTGMPTPVVLDGILFDHAGSGDVTAVNPATGAIRYVQNVGTIPSMVGLLPLGHDAFVTAGQTETSVVAVRAADGSVLWKHVFKDGSGLGDCPPVGDGARVYCDYLMPIPPEPYVMAGQANTMHVYALDAKTGNVVWDTPLEAGTTPKKNQAAIPLLDGNRVIMGSAVGHFVHALDATTGRVLWQTPVRGRVQGGIVALNGVLYFGDFGGYIWALDERTGHVIGAKKFKTAFRVGSPVVVGQTLIDGSFTGRIVAVPLDTIRSSHDDKKKQPPAPPQNAG